MALEVPLTRLQAALAEECVGKWLSGLTVDMRTLHERPTFDLR